MLAFQPDRGQLFPAKLALGIGMVKCFLGLVLVAFGTLALWEDAAMSYLGSGLWCGAVVTLSGLMGVMAGQRQSNLVYIVSFLLMNVLTLAAISLLLIFAATGLARDSDAPYGYFVDQEDGNPVEILGTVPLRQRPVIVNAVLVALGALETIMSLASIFICLREVCQCYSVRQLNKAASIPNMNLLTADQSPEGQARAYRLMRWLGTGHNRPPPLQSLPPHLYPPPHPPHPPRPPRLPRFYRTPAIPVMTPVGHPMAFPSFATGAPTAYVVPSMLPSLVSHQIPHCAGYAPFYSLPVPNSDYWVLQTENKHREKRSRRRSKSRSGLKSDAEEAPAAPAGTEPELPTASGEAYQSLAEKVSLRTDDDSASFVHIGLDRELAEEFIFHSMEPKRNLSLSDTLESKSDL